MHPPGWGITVTMILQPQGCIGYPQSWEPLSWGGSQLWELVSCDCRGKLGSSSLCTDNKVWWELMCNPTIVPFVMPSPSGTRGCSPAPTQLWRRKGVWPWRGRVMAQFHSTLQDLGFWHQGGMSLLPCHQISQPVGQIAGLHGMHLACGWEAEHPCTRQYLKKE